MSALSDSILARLDEIEARLDAIEAKAPRSSAFVAPSMESVYEYFTAHDSSRLVADDFADFYSSKGWMVGKVKMKEWERAAARWIRANPAKAPVSQPDRKPDDVRMSALEDRANRIIADKKREINAVPMPPELRRSLGELGRAMP